MGKQSQLLLQPTEVELGLQVGVEFDKIALQDVGLVSPVFTNLTEKQQFCMLLCPSKPKLTKITNQLIKQMFQLREKKWSCWGV